MDSRIIKGISIFNVIIVIALLLVYSPFKSIYGANNDLSLFAAISNGNASNSFLFVITFVIMLSTLMFTIYALIICLKDNINKSIAGYASVSSFLTIVLEILLFVIFKGTTLELTALVLLIVSILIKIIQNAALAYTIYEIKHLIAE